jgi:hypothetical protein
VRLVRGTRKVVTTGTDDAPGLGVSLDYRWRRRWSASLRYSRFVFPYNDRSDFTNGQTISNKLDLPYNELLAGVDLHLTAGRRLGVAVGLGIGYAWYGNDIRTEGEAVVPADPSTVNRTTFVFRTLVSPAAAARLSVAIPLGRHWSVLPRLAYTFTPLRANLENDPEDPEPGSDIGNPFNPFVASLGLAYHF